MSRTKSFRRKTRWTAIAVAGLALIGVTQSAPPALAYDQPVVMKTNLEAYVALRVYNPAHEDRCMTTTMDRVFMAACGVTGGDWAHIASKFRWARYSLKSFDGKRTGWLYINRDTGTILTWNGGKVTGYTPKDNLGQPYKNPDYVTASLATWNHLSWNWPGGIPGGDGTGAPKVEYQKVYPGFIQWKSEFLRLDYHNNPKKEMTVYQHSRNNSNTQWWREQITN